MFKASALVFFHAETAVHAGSGQSFGAIDLAIQRERHTEHPIIAASGVKGAVRDWFSKHRDFGKEHPAVQALFGPDTKNASEHAGAMAFTDARTLLFPVRSAKGVYALVTCPAVLARLARDLALADVRLLPEDPVTLKGLTALRHLAALKVENNQVLGSNATKVKDSHGVLLEEYAYSFTADEAVADLATWLAENAFPTGAEYEPLRKRLAGHLLVLSDDSFTDFVRHTTEVQARVALNDKKTTTGDGGNLFYQENLPADTVLYSAALAGDDLSGKLNGQVKAPEVLRQLATLDAQRIQLGGDETVGKGICCTRFLFATQTGQNG